MHACMSHRLRKVSLRELIGATFPLHDLRCVQQGGRYKPLRLSMLFDTTLRKDIYEALRAEHSVEFLGNDLQTSHNTPPLIMAAAMFRPTCEFVF